MIGSSVVPGLPNMWVTPSDFSSSMKALRPLMVLDGALAGIVDPPSVRQIALHHRAVHAAAVAHVVVRRGLVHGRAVVPDQQVTDAPAVAGDEAVLGRERVELGEQRLAVGERHALELADDVLADIERTAAGL